MPIESRIIRIEDKLEELIRAINSSSADDFRQNIEPIIDEIYVIKDELKEAPEEIKRKFAFVLVIILQVLNNFDNKNVVMNKLKLFRNKKSKYNDWHESFIMKDIMDMVDAIRKNAVKE